MFEEGSYSSQSSGQQKREDVDGSLPLPPGSLFSPLPIKKMAPSVGAK